MAFAGLAPSAWVFLTITDVPRLRLSGEFTFVQVGASGETVAGAGYRLGVHYRF